MIKGNTKSVSKEDVEDAGYAGNLCDASASPASFAVDFSGFQFEEILNGQSAKDRET